MPLVTTLIDDTSPLILYDNTWIPGSSSGDNFTSLYYLSTFSTNSVTDGAATFSFNGTAFWIYGAKRPNHGTFTVKVDQQSYAGLNGAANNVFQTPLFNLSGLSQGMHTVSLTNTGTGGQYVDIDMIIWQSEVGSDGDQLVTEIVEDTDSRFQYQEPAWGASSDTLDFNLFSNGSGHATQTYQASVTFTFTGEAITFFGTSGPSNGPYTVQLDGGQAVTYNATHGSTTNYGVAIYHADNLGPGSHQVVLSNLPGTGGQSLSIDYAQLWTTANASSGSSTSSSGAFTSSTSHGTMSTGAIAGIVVAVAVAVIAAGAAFFFYRRWKAALVSQSNPCSPVQRSGSTFMPSETRSIGTVLQSDASSSRPYGADNTHATQFGRPSIQPLPGSQPSQGVAEASGFQLPSSTDEQGQGRRRLPETPGFSLSTDVSRIPRLTRSSTVGGASTVVSEPPPNYMEAMVER